jgi:adenosine deaminase
LGLSRHAESPEVMRFLADHRIRLNVCPTSNILLGRVKRLEDHPIRKLFDAGVRVTVNTDDAIVFGVGVSEEFLRLRQSRGSRGRERAGGARRGNRLDGRRR